jgi:hypothetical protein
MNWSTVCQPQDELELEPELEVGTAVMSPDVINRQRLVCARTHVLKTKMQQQEEYLQGL